MQRENQIGNLGRDEIIQNTNVDGFAILIFGLVAALSEAIKNATPGQDHTSNRVITGGSLSIVTVALFRQLKKMCCPDNTTRARANQGAVPRRGGERDAPPSSSQRREVNVVGAPVGVVIGRPVTGVVIGRPVIEGTGQDQAVTGLPATSPKEVRIERSSGSRACASTDSDKGAKI